MNPVYNQSTERILAKPEIEQATSYSQVCNATNWAMGLGTGSLKVKISGTKVEREEHTNTSMIVFIQETFNIFHGLQLFRGWSRSTRHIFNNPIYKHTLKKKIRICPHSIFSDINLDKKPSSARFFSFFSMQRLQTNITQTRKISKAFIFDHLLQMQTFN